MSDNLAEVSHKVSEKKRCVLPTKTKNICRFLLNSSVLAVSACLQYMRWIAVARALRPCPAPPHGSARGGQVRRGNSGRETA